MTFHYNVDGGYPEMAGRASTKFKSVLKDLGVDPSVIRPCIHCHVRRGNQHGHPRQRRRHPL